MRVPLAEEVTQEASSGRETGVGLGRTANEYRVELVECEVETHRWREGCDVPKDREKDSGMSLEVEEEIVGGEVIVLGA